MSSPELTFLMIMLNARVDKARQAERGASAVEWVIITVILVGIAATLGILIRGKVEDKAGEINLNTN